MKGINMRQLLLTGMIVGGVVAFVLPGSPVGTVSLTSPGQNEGESMRDPAAVTAAQTVRARARNIR